MGNVVLSSSSFSSSSSPSPSSSPPSVSPAHTSLWDPQTNRAQARLVHPQEAAPLFTASRDTTLSCHFGPSSGENFHSSWLELQLNATTGFSGAFFFCFSFYDCPNTEYLYIFKGFIVLSLMPKIKVSKQHPPNLLQMEENLYFLKMIGGIFLVCVFACSEPIACSFKYD